ncbi:MAG: HIT family protein [Theionarchaea archaeon]|nr:HIT family protein [Theionarchaea archaeon]
MTCKYCLIAQKAHPAHIIFEDKSVVAFLMENPVSLGHTIVIPREHAEHYSLLTDVEGFAGGLQLLLRILEEKLSPHLNLIINQGKKAGQDIDHFHIHVIPRYEGEKIFEWTWHQLTDEEVKTVMEKIQG